MGYGAFTPHGELTSPVVVFFDSEEIDSMQYNQLSSVLRETKNSRLTVETLIESLHGIASQVAGMVCVYTGDCFPAIQNMSNMKGSVQVFPKVKQLYESAAGADLLLEFVWKPRTDADMVYAGELSRMVDSSETFLAQFAFNQICSLQLWVGQSWGVPTLDCFAQGMQQVSIM